jgi:hypothetical protein
MVHSGAEVEYPGVLIHLGMAVVVSREQTQQRRPAMSPAVLASLYHQCSATPNLNIYLPLKPL